MFTSLIYETQVLQVNPRRKRKQETNTFLLLCSFNGRVKMIGAEDTKLTRYCPAFNSRSSWEKQREDN